MSSGNFSFLISRLEKLVMKAHWVKAAESLFLFFSAYIIEKVFNTEEMSTCKVITHYGPDFLHFGLMEHSDIYCISKFLLVK